MLPPNAAPNARLMQHRSSPSLPCSTLLLSSPPLLQRAGSQTLYPHANAPSLTQPHPPKQQHQRREKRNPRFPSDPGLLCHPQHPVHRAADLVPGVLELVVHLFGQGGRVADLIADEVRQLW